MKFFSPGSGVFFFKHKKKGWIFFENLLFCFWFEVGLDGPTQRARESLK